MGPLKNRIGRIVLVITFLLYVVLNVLLTVSSFGLIPKSARDRSSESIEDSKRNGMFLYEVYPTQNTFKYKNKDLEIGKGWVETPRKIIGRIVVLPFWFNLYSNNEGHVFVFEIVNLRDFSGMEKTSFDFKEIEYDSFFSGGFQNHLYRLKLNEKRKTFSVSFSFRSDWKNSSEQQIVSFEETP